MYFILGYRGILVIIFTVLLSSEILSGVTDDRVLLRWAVLRALRIVAACTNFDTNRGPSRSMKKNKITLNTKVTGFFVY